MCPLRVWPPEQVCAFPWASCRKLGDDGHGCPVPSSSSVCPAGPAESAGAPEPGDGPPAEAGVPGGLAAAGGPDAAAVPCGEWDPRALLPSLEVHIPRGAGKPREGESQEESRTQQSWRPDRSLPWGACEAEQVGKRGRPGPGAWSLAPSPASRGLQLGVFSPLAFRSWPRSTRRPCSCCGSSRPSFWMMN